MKLQNWALSVAAVAALGFGVAARGDDVKDVKTTARAVAAKTAKAVISARLVLKITIGEREQEQKVEIAGTVIDSSGLTVVSAAALDPAATVRAGRGGRGGGGGGGGADMKIESEVTETALVLEDGTELEADVVLKDAELDLAFIRPRDAKAKLDCVELKELDKAPQPLDDVFVVGRLGRLGNRAISLSLGAIKSVVKGPRTFYVCDDHVSASSTGCVGYAADGTPLGIFVTKRAGEGAPRGGREAGMVILRPAGDVLELAKQAKQAKAPEAKKKDADEDSTKKDEKPKAPAPDKKKGDDF
jgi:hypothetical protein